MLPQATVPAARALRIATSPDLPFARANTAPVGFVLVGECEYPSLSIVMNLMALQEDRESSNHYFRYQRQASKKD